MRNPEYQFVPTDTDEIVSELTRGYELLTGAAPLPASPETLFIRWVAHVLIQERVLSNWAGNQNIPSRAEGENLDALAALTNCRPRPEAERAVCTVRFHISQARETATLVPAGTRVTDGALVWETLEDAYVPAGETYVDAAVRCQTAGLAGNGRPPGTIRTIVDLYGYYAGCENVTESEGGADRADDEAYYGLMRASMDSYSCAGARGAYVYFARQVSTEIADVAAASPAPGVVKLYVLMKGGEPAGDEIKRAVLAACSADEVRPMTDLVSVEDAETVPYDVAFTYYTQTGTAKSGARMEEDIRAAVDRYAAWQSARLGRDINPDVLREYLYHTGIKRVELASPAFTALRDGRDRLAPQVARLGTVRIVNGGMENE